MTTLREWITRLWGTLRPNRRDAELEEELRCHLELAAEHERRRFDSTAAAHRAAAIRSGGVAQAMEAVRDQRGLPWLDDFGRDLRYALRDLRRNPMFASVAVLTLGLAIGANTAIFSVTEAVMLRAIPIESPQDVYFVGQGSPARPRLGSNYPYLERIRALRDVFADVTAYTRNAFKVSTGDAIEITQGQFVSGNYHAVLGVPIAVGRGFTSEDDRAGGAAPVAVISDGYWSRKFGRSPDALGRTIEIDGRPVTIVGVTASGFAGLEAGTRLDITLPLAIKTLEAPGFLTMHDTWTSMPIVARLKSGVVAAEAASAVETVSQQYFSEPENAWLKKGPRSDQFRASWLVPANRGTSHLRDRYARPLQVLMAMVVLVLLVACASVANLLMARGTARAKEVAVRLSIGASRLRLVRQLLTESVLVAALGGALGLALAVVGADAIVAQVGGGPNPVLLDVGPNATVLAFTIGVSALTTMLFGLAPALCTTRVDLTPMLKDASAPLRRSGRGWSARQALVAAQIALCLVLVSGAVLLGRTLRNLETRDGGFDPSNLVLFSLDARGTAFPSAEMPQFCEALIARLVARFNAASGSCSTSVPIHSRGNARPLEVPGAPPQSLDARLVFMNRVTPDYFRTLGIGVASGRVFDTRDSARSERVAIMNRSAVRFFFGSDNPIGRTVHFHRDEQHPLTIVGVVEDAAQYSLRQDPLNTVYTPLTQLAEPESHVTVTLRARQDSPALRQSLRSEVRALNDDIAVDYIRTMGQQIDVTLVREHVLAMLSSAFGLLALVLSCVGLSGVVSYDANGRARELAIRAALGATRADVLGHVLRRALSVSAVGVVTGLAAAFAATRLLSTLLFGITPRDPLTFASTAAIIVVATMAAGYLPAHRASRLDPAVVLRTE